MVTRGCTVARQRDRSPCAWLLPMGPLVERKGLRASSCWLGAAGPQDQGSDQDNEAGTSWHVHFDHEEQGESALQSSQCFRGEAIPSGQRGPARYLSRYVMRPRVRS